MLFIQHFPFLHYFQFEFSTEVLYLNSFFSPIFIRKYFSFYAFQEFIKHLIINELSPWLLLNVTLSQEFF